MNINDRIEKVIKHFGLNMNTFAKKASINYVTLYNIVSHAGRRSDPHASTLVKIKLAFDNIDMNWLLTGDGEMILPDPPMVEEPESGYGKEGSRDIYQILDNVVKELQSLRGDVDEIKKDEKKK